MFYNTFQISYIEAAVNNKNVFYQLFNLLKCIVVGLSMVEDLFSLLLYCESGINNMLDRKL